MLLAILSLLNDAARNIGLQASEGLLGHIVSFFNFGGATKLFYTVVAPFCIPSSKARATDFSISLLVFIFHFSNFLTSRLHGGTYL